MSNGTIKNNICKHATEVAINMFKIAINFCCVERPYVQSAIFLQKARMCIIARAMNILKHGGAKGSAL